MSNKTIDYLFKSSIFILISCLLLGVPLSISRYFYQKGLEFTASTQLDPAQEYFEKALKRLPFKNVIKGFTADEQRIRNGLGEVHFQKAVISKDIRLTTTELRKALTIYHKAVILNKYDFDSAIGLAKIIAALDQLFRVFKPEKTSPYVADKYFQKAILLKPSNIAAHHMYCNYLGERGDYENLRHELANLIEKHPRLYFQLSRENYYSDDLEEAVREGLEEAIRKEKFKRSAYYILAEIALNMRDVKTALDYYVTFIALDPEENIDKDFYKYGQILLLLGNQNAASEQFLHALTISDSREIMLEKIYSEYVKLEKYSELISFFSVAKDLLEIEGIIDVYVAKGFALAGQVELAIARLNRMDGSTCRDKQYYYLAYMYEKLKDWDAMELYSQRATLVAPQNSMYYAFFAKALSRQGKYFQAEGAIDQAIANSSKPNSWLYNQRGWIRWNERAYSGAAADWEKAIELQPDQASFYYQLSLAYKKLGRNLLSRKYAKAAAEKAPDSLSYQQHLDSFE